MSFKRMSDDLGLKLSKLVDLKLTDAHSYTKVLSSGNQNKLIEFLKEVYSINQSRFESLWFESANSTYDLTIKRGAFTDVESALLFFILQNNGVVSLADAKRLNCLRSNQAVNDAANSLQENGLVLRVQLTRDVIFILDIDFFIKVVHDE